MARKFLFFLLFLTAFRLLAVPLLSLEFQLPAGSPLPSSLIAYFIDEDHTWHQILLDGKTTVPRLLKSSAKESKNTQVGFDRYYLNLSPARFTPPIPASLLNRNCKIGLKKSATGEEITVYSHQICPSNSIPVPFDLHATPKTPIAGKMLTVSFRLTKWPTEPFTCDNEIRAKIRKPDGSIETITGFYMEDFLWNPQEKDFTKCLTPYAEHLYQVRYTPEKPGKYIITITGKIDATFFEIPPQEFNVQAAEREPHGVLQISRKNPLHLEYADGTPFEGIGVNIRSPYDNRYKQIIRSSSWKDMGMGAYRLLFPKLKEAGVNVVEVWMCSWWMALEWSPNAPGFHGVGFYNQQRAWLLDELFRLAEENDISLILVLNNHGKFGESLDTEWKFNPYNIRNGGHLKRAQEYFSDGQAWEETKSLLSYINARWGQHPNLLFWKLFTEIDLTGPNIEWYRKAPELISWHKKASSWLKTIDAKKHLVTTHWMLTYQRINQPLAQIPELDLLTTDAYYGGGVASLLHLLHGSAAYAKKMKKPLVITEFGGSSHGDHAFNLAKQVSLGTWAGYFENLAMPPMFWWFALIEERNLYGTFHALRSFSNGIDRTDMVPTQKRLKEQKLRLYLLQNKQHTLVYLLDEEYYLSGAKNFSARMVPQATLHIAVPPHASKAILTSPLDGRKLGEIPLKPGVDGTAAITLPPFQKAIAIRIDAIPQKK